MKSCSQKPEKMRRKQEFNLNREEQKSNRKGCNLQEKKNLESEARERRRIEELSSFTSDILDWGFWQSVKQVDQHMSMYLTDKENISGLKAKLKFRKEVPHQKPKDSDLKMYIPSPIWPMIRIQLGLEELPENVKKLVSHALNLPTANDGVGPVLVDMNIRMRFKTEDDTQWYKGFVISKVVKVL